MSFFPSPSIRMKLGQHSAAEGREAGRMGAHGKRKKVFIKDTEVEVGGGKSGRGGEKEARGLSDPEMLRLCHLIGETKLCWSERLLFKLIPHCGFSSGLAFGYLH